MAPSVLEGDPNADVDQGQVVVEDVAMERRDDDEPAGESDRDDQEPGEPESAEVAQRAGVEPAKDQLLWASGTGFRGSGPMYSDCGRIMRLLAACSST